MKSNKYIFIFATIVLLFLTGCSNDKPQIYDPDQRFAAEDLKADFQTIKDMLLEEHPAVPHYNNIAEFEEYLDSVYNSIGNSMNVREFYVLLAGVLEKANCGHTRLHLPEYYWYNMHQNHKYFPYKVHYTDGRLFIHRDFVPDSPIPPGSEIVSINDIPASAMVQKALSLKPSDGHNLTYKYWNLNTISLGLFPGYIDYPDEYLIEYIPPGDLVAQKTEIAALHRDTIRMIQRERYADDEEWEPYSFEIIDSLKTAVITLNVFMNIDGYDIPEFLERSFGTLIEADAENLIIDVRGNDGGDPANAAPIIEHIIDSAFVYFKGFVHGYAGLKNPVEPHDVNFEGKVYMLIDGGSFSTTGHLLALMRYHNLTVMIGEESGGSYRCNGCDNYITLTNSGLRLNYPRCVYEVEVYGFGDDHGMIPDIEVIPSIDDIISNRDAVMEFTLGLIGGGELGELFNILPHSS